MATETTKPLGGDPPRDSPALFARKATGLVREVSGRQAMVFNFIASLPSVGLAIGVFYALAGFPGGNLQLGILLTVPIAIAFAYAFGLMTAALPRSGGDYMIVSRILHPQLGLISSCCMLMSAILSVAFVAQAGVLLGLGPAFTTVGLAAHSATLIHWGTSVATSKGWQFGIGGAVIVGAGVLGAGGWKVSRRALIWGTGLSMFGLLLTVLITLFTSRGGFTSAFNHFAAPYTHTSNTYAATIRAAAKAGVNVHPGLSLSHTFPLIAVMAGFSIYTFNTTFIGGEIRQGSSVRTAHRMAIPAVLGLVCIAVCSAVFYKTWGSSFLTAAFGGGWPSSLGTLPGYFFLASAGLQSTVGAVILCVLFVAGFFVGIIAVIVFYSRVFFAWAFDGILPEGVTRVNARRAPIVAIAVMVGLALAGYIWAIFIATNFVQVVTYASLIQLVAMGLVGLSAAVFPYRRRELYRASTTHLRIAGVPVVTLAGCGAIASCVFLYYLYFHYAFFGLTNKGTFFAWLFGTVGFGALYYLGARQVRRREGIDLRLTYAEIPPE